MIGIPAILSHKIKHSIDIPYSDSMLIAQALLTSYGVGFHLSAITSHKSHARWFYLNLSEQGVTPVNYNSTVFFTDESEIIEAIPEMITLARLSTP